MKTPKLLALPGLIILLIAVAAGLMFRPGQSAQTSPAPEASTESPPSPQPPAPETGSDLDLPTPQSQRDPAASAAQVAQRVLTAWGRPAADYEQWLADLEPLMTRDAWESYSYTDPAQLPDIEITGTPSEGPDPTGNVTTIYFDTTEGRFGVDMVREPDSSRWEAFFIVFPGGESQRQ